MSDTKRQTPKDIAILSGPTEDGQGARVVRIREGGDVTAGEIRPVREGEPLHQSELVRLRPLDASQRVCEVEVLHAPEERSGRGGSRGARGRDTASSSGPARVSNAKYRNNWSLIFESADAASRMDHDDRADRDAHDVKADREVGKTPHVSAKRKQGKSGWSVN